MEKVRSNENNSSLPSGARGVMLAVSMAVAGCAGAPTQPITRVKVSDKNSVTVTQYCYSVPERTCKTITYRDGVLINDEPGCPSNKYNGAPCLSEKETIATPTTLYKK